MRRALPRGYDEHVLEQARMIRDIAQAIVDACESGNSIDPYARNKVAGGALAQDAAVLAMMIIQHEMEYARDD